ncbi:MAG TPA: copper amine oxidase N-terminal domain-containing protein [Clostridia bacterium]
MKKITLILTTALLAVSFCISPANAHGNKQPAPKPKQEIKKVDDKIKKQDEQIKKIDEKIKKQDEQIKKKMEDLKNGFMQIHRDRDKRKDLLKELAKIRKENNNNNIPVFVSGNEVDFDVPPVLYGGRTLIPLRAVSNALGADVKWDDLTSTATVTKAVYSDVYGEKQIKIELNISTKIVIVNGTQTKLDVPPQVMGGRTMVPLRFISETFNREVDWDSDSRTVVIEEKYSMEQKVTVTGTNSGPANRRY